MIKFGSVCSGIEAASVAWLPIGWEASWLAEIEPFPSAILAHHYPDTPNLGDMTIISDKVLGGEIEAPDVLVGGTPCQSFSVAGLRNGLSDDRGKLTLEFVRIANAIDTIRQGIGERESIIVWENVPGVLSSKDNAFGCFLAALAGESEELQPTGSRWTNAGLVRGPQRTIAWRVLDAQYFGVAQRRRRVFVVASARDGFCPAKVLFEFDGVRRDFAPSREAWKETASYVGASANQTGFRKLTFESYAQDETASTMMARDCKSYTDLVAFNSRQDPVSGDVFGSLDTCRPQAQAVAIAGNIIGRQTHNGGNGNGFDDSGACYTLTTSDRHAAFYPSSPVRRLTPVECERLQGFDDGYTMIPWCGKPTQECPDGHRYKAPGNSMCVNVMRWIGDRIAKEIGNSTND